METRIKCWGARPDVSRKDSLIGGALTIGSALIVAAIMLIGHNQVTESIGLVMFPGVLAVGMQWIYLKRHSTPARIVLIVGPFLALFLIGILVSVNVTLTGWALTNIVEMRETAAGDHARMEQIEDSRFTDANGLQLKAELTEKIDHHTH